MEERQKRVPTAYHCGTLVGNWEEERKTFGQPVPTIGANDPIDPNTTYTTSYKRLEANQIAGAKPPSCFSEEAPKQLLFYHGDVTKPEKSQYSVAELSYTNRKEDPTTTEDVLDRAGVSRRNDKTATLRRENGIPGGDSEDGVNRAAMRETNYMRSLNSTRGGGSQSGDDVDTYGYQVPAIPPVGRVEERNRLLTTKNVTVDATGEYLKQNLEPYPLTSTENFSEMTTSLDNPMYRTRLRKP